MYISKINKSTLKKYHLHMTSIIISKKTGQNGEKWGHTLLQLPSMRAYFSY